MKSDSYTKLHELKLSFIRYIGSIPSENVYEIGRSIVLFDTVYEILINEEINRPSIKFLTTTEPDEIFCRILDKCVENKVYLEKDRIIKICIEVADSLVTKVSTL